MKKNQIPKEKQQPPYSSHTKEAILITAGMLGLIICLAVLVDLVCAGLAHKTSGHLPISVNETSVTITAVCFLALFFGVIWALKKRNRNFYKALHQSIAHNKQS